MSTETPPTIRHTLTITIEVLHPGHRGGALEDIATRTLHRLSDTAPGALIGTMQKFLADAVDSCTIPLPPKSAFDMAVSIAAVVATADLTPEQVAAFQAESRIDAAATAPTSRHLQ